MPAFTGDEVPHKYPAGIAGRGYMVSREPGLYKRQSIPLQRPQQDNSAVQGEASLNPEELWRKSLESWHRGAGQSSFDRADGDPFRFDASLGVDPWEKWELGLLNDTDRKLASTETTLKLVVAGSYLYAAEGQVLKYTQTLPNSGVATWTTVTGTPAAAITGLTSDGNRIWIAYGASGIYSTTRGAATATQYSFLKADTLGFEKGRLMTSRNNSVYNVTASSAPVAYRSQSEKSWATTSGTGARAVSVSMPTGVEASDLLILNIVGFRDTTTPGSATISVTPDWTLLDTTTFEPSGSARQLIVHTYFKLSGGSESAVVVTTTHSTASSFETLATVIAYDNANPDMSIDVHSQGTLTTVPGVLCGQVVTTTDQSLLVFIGHGLRMGSAAGTSFTPPTGFAERRDFTWYGSTDSMTVAYFDKTQATAGGSGPVSADAANDLHSVAHLISIRPNVPESLTAHSNTDFRWVGFAAGPNNIYAAGFSGDKSIIYRTEIKADGTALDAPIVAGELPDGEIVRGMGGYLGFVFVGTDFGFRMATSDADGNLTFGSLVETPGPVRCFEGQGQYVWFGYESFDVSRWASGSYDGLGRMDLTQFPSPLTPAHASDLMVTGSTGTTEQVQSIVTFAGRTVFSVADSGGASRGVYASTDQKVATGYLDSGTITYGISDTKVATYLDLRHLALTSGASVAASLSTNGGAFTSLGSSSTAGSTKPASALSAGPSRGETFEVRVALSRASGSDGVGPKLTRCTLRSEPAPLRGTVFQVPVLLFEDQHDLAGQEFTMDVNAELALLEGLFATQTLVTYKEMNTSYSVFVRDIQFVAESSTADRRFHQGVCLVTLKAPGA